MSGRRAAFEKPLPASWRPKFGEEVYIAPVIGTLGRLVSTGRVLMVADDLVRVKVCYGRQCTTDQWWLHEIRPFETP